MVARVVPRHALADTRLAEQDQRVAPAHPHVGEKLH
jgi:hypothetical protein